MTPGPSKRVLLVDDGRAEGRLTALSLRNAGCLVTIADNASAAFRCLPGGAFDMMICDQRLPDLLGTNLLRLITRTVRPAPPMLLLSSDESRTTRDAALRAGAIAVLAKPVAPQQLTALVFAHAVAPGARHVDHLLVEDHTDDFLLAATSAGEREQLALRWLDVVRAQLSVLAGHVAGQAQPGWRQELHRLRGSASLVGAIRLEEAAAALEKAAPRHESLELLVSLVDTTGEALIAHAGATSH